jgi:amidase/aspartyl-tRNA(Asn)/glutamyl-tRNA(Gln) amidotransferase subunit A
MLGAMLGSSHRSFATPFCSQVRDLFIGRSPKEQRQINRTSIPVAITQDLSSAVAQVSSGARCALDLMSAALAASRHTSNSHTYVRRCDEAACIEAARAIDDRRARTGSVPALAGLSVSVKDLYDVAGHPTTAGSKVLADAPPAQRDCPAVARMRAAGAVFTGHTNMTEFAYSGVGINPHHGTPANPVTAALDALDRIPGGSTSGGAVTVATGAAWAALGSDTGGSIRIPAALQGLVGFKNTARLTPTEGTLPLSTTLDTVCAITLTVRDAVLVHEVLADRKVVLVHKPAHALRLALPTTTMLDHLDTAVARAFSAAVQTLRAAGATIVEIEMPQIAALSQLQARGGFAAAEAWAWHRRLLSAREAEYDPRVATRIRGGEQMSAADYIDLVAARRAWIGQMASRLEGFDAALSPTVPMVAPPLAPLVASDEAFFAANALLLRNPSVVNMLDGCALSMPCHAPGSMPVGLMLWSTALQDDTLLDASLAVEAALASRP